jgi:hypothetical protein
MKFVFSVEKIRELAQIYYVNKRETEINVP